MIKLGQPSFEAEFGFDEECRRRIAVVRNASHHVFLVIDNTGFLMIFLKAWIREFG